MSLWTGVGKHQELLAELLVYDPASMLPVKISSLKGIWLIKLHTTCAS